MRNNGSLFVQLQGQASNDIDHVIGTIMFFNAEAVLVTPGVGDNVLEYGSYPDALAITDGSVDFELWVSSGDDGFSVDLAGVDCPDDIEWCEYTQEEYAAALEYCEPDQDMYSKVVEQVDEECLYEYLCGEDDICDVPEVGTVGVDETYGSNYIVCRADEQSAWVAHNDPSGNYYNALGICETL
ncbi:MAG: hypothetical protein H6765_09465 [Candidatus Peribacteria bacterium]|nr:MAG: hypothetical protein H6765_09465 [Candidatus Peribacteria bacterium]